jgi:hypothetical protein
MIDCFLLASVAEKKFAIEIICNCKTGNQFKPEICTPFGITFIPDFISPIQSFNCFGS